MVKLPILQTLVMMQTKWKSILDPMLANPSLQTSLLLGVSLINGTTVVNHLLGRKIIGWRVVGSNASASIYDIQASNQTPELTLILVSNAVVTVNLEVF